MDLRLALMTGIDIPIPECQITVHQPTLKEIAYIGEKEFLTGAQCLCLNKNMFVQGTEIPDEINNFQIFIKIMENEESRDKKEATQQVLSLIFPKYISFFTPNSLMLKDDSNNTILIDSNNFEFLQENLNHIFCFKSNLQSQAGFNPADAKAKEIAEKLMRGRQRVAEQNGDAQSSVFTQYISALTVGINSMSLDQCINLTIFQLYDLIERYMLYVNWDLDLRARLAGAKNDSKPDNWMKNIH